MVKAMDVTKVHANLRSGIDTMLQKSKIKKARTKHTRTWPFKLFCAI